MSQSHGCRSRTSDSVMPPPPRIVTWPSSRLRPRGPDHSAALAYAADVAEPGDAERQRHLGDRFGVHALAARPHAVVVEVVDEVLDAGERQLHPTDVVGVVEASRSARRAGVGPHDRLGLVGPTSSPPPAMTASASQSGAESGRDGYEVHRCSSSSLHRSGRSDCHLRPSIGHDDAMTTAAPAVRTVGVPREVKTAEHRVAMSPDGVRELERHGIEVLVESGAGEGASITDDDYVAAGAEIIPTAADAWAQEMVVKVKEPQPSEYGFLRDDLTLFTYLHLAAYPAVAEALLAAKTRRSPTRRCSVDGHCHCSHR